MSPLQRNLYCCGGLYQRTSGPSFSELKFRDKQNCSPTAAIISGFMDRRLVLMLCWSLAGETMRGNFLQAPAVRKVNTSNSLHGINHYPSDSLFILLTLIHWIAIYAVDSAFEQLGTDPCKRLNCSPLNFVFSSSRKEPLL